MLSPARIALNRIVYPNTDLQGFMALTSELGLSMVELRNDLPDRRITGGLEPKQVRELAQQFGISIVSINALQKFNLPSHLPDAVEELKNLLDLSSAINCPAIVLCPLNDKDDIREPRQCFEETVRCLQTYQPMFAHAGIRGYVEALGFAESSLASLITAQEAIRESQASCYRLVYDTFHHAIGPDSPEGLEAQLDVGLIGLIHASGVEADLPRERYRDEHRVLITEADRFQTLEQISFLLRKNFTGPVSLELFAVEIQNLPRARFVHALNSCLDLLYGRL